MPINGLELANNLIDMGKNKVDPNANKLSEDAVNFGNWAGTKDTKVMAKDLMKKGLEGADQLYYENQDNSSRDAITRGNQSDWKIAAVQKILSKAYSKGMRTPEEIMNNKKFLLSGLDKPYQDAINSQQFNNVHPNFWNVIGEQLLPQQWAKVDAMNKQNLAKK